MAKKKLFGEFLVEKKAITGDQLEEAINSQVVFGGRLGTNLIELGYVREKTLGQALSEKHGVPYIPPDRLSEIESKVIKAFPKALAVKHKAVPFRMEGKKIHLLMLDPSDFQAIDEIGFALNCVVKPYAIPELRLLALLEKYYGLKRDLRYITLSRTDTEEFLKGRREAAEPNAGPFPAVPPPPSPLQPPKAAVRDTIALSPGEDLMPEEEFKKFVIPATRPPAPQEEVLELSQEAEDVELVPVTAEAPKPPPPDIADEIILDATIIQKLEESLVSGELMKDLADERAPAPAVQRPEAPGPSAPIPTPLSFSEASQRLESASQRDDIAAAVLGLALSSFKRAIIFTVQRGLVLGWDGHGEGLERGIAEKIAVPLTLPSSFKLVYDTSCQYVGSFPPTPVNDGFLRAISPRRRPKSSILIPILFKGKIVNLLYGDNGQEDATTDIGELLILAQKIPLTFEKLVQKRKKLAA